MLLLLLLLLGGNAALTNTPRPSAGPLRFLDRSLFATTSGELELRAQKPEKLAQTGWAPS